MSTRFNAIVARKNADGAFAAGLETLDLADLPDEPVLVDVEYSTVNYKDGLAVTNAAPICQKLPMVCGIDLAGTVAESNVVDWQIGDKGLVNGYGLSERHWGAYSQKQRVNPDFLLRIPAAFTAEEAMAIGTAGYTAMLAVNAIRDHGTQPGDGPVLVTRTPVASVRCRSCFWPSSVTKSSPVPDARRRRTISNPWVRAASWRATNSRARPNPWKPSAGRRPSTASVRPPRHGARADATTA